MGRLRFFDVAENETIRIKFDAGAERNLSIWFTPSLEIFRAEVVIPCPLYNSLSYCKDTHILTASMSFVLTMPDNVNISIHAADEGADYDLYIVKHDTPADQPAPETPAEEGAASEKPSRIARLLKATNALYGRGQGTRPASLGWGALFRAFGKGRK